MQLWKHRNRIYYILYGKGLKRRVSTRMRDRGEAEAYLAQFILGAQNPLIKDPTVGELLAQYEEEHGPEVRSPDALKYAVLPLRRQLGTLQPGHLFPPVVKKYARDRGAAPGTILREIGVLRAALAWAKANGRIVDFPHIYNPVAAPAPRQRWLTKTEGRKLLEAANEPHLKLFIMLGLTTAARMGAILELTWDRVDFERRLIDYGEGYGNKRRAVAPIGEDLLEMLRGAKALASTPYVIEYRGARVLEIKNGFRAACRRAVVEGVTPHILRHSAASWMAQAGIPFRHIAQMLGDEERTVEKVYAKFSPEYLRGASDALKF